MDGIGVRIACRVCGEHFMQRTPLHEVCDIYCCYRDPEHHKGQSNREAHQHIWEKRKKLNGNWGR